MSGRSDHTELAAAGAVSAEHSRLLDFLYRSPVGIIEMRANGDIELINAYASRILMPLDPDAGLSNLFDVLAPSTDELRARIEAFALPRGQLCANHRVAIQGARDQAGRSLFLGFTIHKLEPDCFLVSFFDDSERVAQEAAMAEAIEVQAHQAGRIEIATTIMHDIGNAVTGLGALIGRLTAESAWPESQALDKLMALLRRSEGPLAQAFGPDRSQALIRYVDALAATFARREDEYREATRELAESIHHVQDILTIQRQLTRDGAGPPRAPLRLHDLVHDALAISESSLGRRGIRVEVAVPVSLPPIPGDRTRLIQVLLNLLKNAADAFAARSEAPGAAAAVPLIEIRAQALPSSVHMQIHDNGPGFEPGQAERLFMRGKTGKRHGTGLGLYTSRLAIEAHGGSIHIDSPGPGQGATVTIELPCPGHLQAACAAGRR